MSVTIKRPATNVSRFTALKKALAKNLTVPVAERFFTTATTTRLTTNQGAYKLKYEAIPLAEAVAAAATSTKNKNKAELALFCSCFFTAIVQGIRMKTLQATDKPYYGMAVDSDAFPPMVTDDEVLSNAKQLVTGEAARVALGGTAIPWPLAAEVQALIDLYEPSIMEANTKADALDVARESLDDMNTEVDGCLKKVWDEVETHYNEEEPASKRASARLWGVVYINTDLAKTTLTAHLQAASNHLPIPGGTYEAVETGDILTTDASGNLSGKVQWEGELNINISAPGFVGQSKVVTIVPGVDQNLGLTELVAV